jgi:hypothetical protein
MPLLIILHRMREGYRGVLEVRMTGDDNRFGSIIILVGEKSYPCLYLLGFGWVLGHPVGLIKVEVNSITMTRWIEEPIEEQSWQVR